MADKITARFFKVRTKDDNLPNNFVQALSETIQLQNHDRERPVYGKGYRLENFEQKNSVFIGEVIRIQRENLPVGVLADSIEPLDNEALGFGVTFLFDPAINVLVMESDMSACSHSKFYSYYNSLEPTNPITLDPILNQDAWDRFDDSELRKIKMRVAVPNNFAHLAGNSELVNSIGGLAEAYEAPYVKVELSFGRKEGVLTRSIKGALRSVFNSGAEVTSLEVKPEDEEPINLIKELLKYKDEISLNHGISPEQSFNLRSNFLLRAYNEHRQYLVGLFNGGTN